MSGSVLDRIRSLVRAVRDVRRTQYDEPAEFAAAVLALSDALDALDDVLEKFMKADVNETDFVDIPAGSEKDFVTKQEG